MNNNMSWLMIQHISFVSQIMTCYCFHPKMERMAFQISDFSRFNWIFTIKQTRLNILIFSKKEEVKYIDEFVFWKE